MSAGVEWHNASHCTEPRSPFPCGLDFSRFVVPVVDSVDCKGISGYTFQVTMQFVGNGCRPNVVFIKLACLVTVALGYFKMKHASLNAKNS